MSAEFPETPDVINVFTPKKKGAPIQRTAKQQAAIERVERENDLATQRTKAASDAAVLAQVVNLVIGGHSYEEIGASIGATAAEVEAMVTTGADRYIRTQPALRTWVRKWISAKYTEMIEADWAQASDSQHAEKLEHQDRVVKMLAHLSKLHGADAPTQAEVKVEHSSDAVERLVQDLAAKAGKSYDDSVFDGDDDDIVDADVIHDTATDALAALEAASKATEQAQPEDEENPL